MKVPSCLWNARANVALAIEALHAAGISPAQAIRSPTVKSNRGELAQKLPVLRKYVAGATGSHFAPRTVYLRSTQALGVLPSAPQPQPGDSFNGRKPISAISSEPNSARFGSLQRCFGSLRNHLPLMFGDGRENMQGQAGRMRVIHSNKFDARIHLWLVDPLDDGRQSSRVSGTLRQIEGLEFV